MAWQDLGTDNKNLNVLMSSYAIKCNLEFTKLNFNLSLICMFCCEEETFMLLHLDNILSFIGIERHL